MNNEHITASPLCWPDGWKRQPADWRIRSRFQDKRYNRPSVYKASRFVIGELERMAVQEHDIIISSDLRLRNDGLPYSNQRAPEDPGISVWWYDPDRVQRVIAIDLYDRPGCNLWAIAKTIEALRGIERWGGGEILERTFTGFAALPETASTPWRDVLEYHGTDIVCRLK